MTTKTVSIIVSRQDEVNLATVAERFPLVTRHRLAQAAYRYGLRACVRCPDLVVEEASACRRRHGALDRGLTSLARSGRSLAHPPSGRPRHEEGDGLSPDPSAKSVGGVR